MIIQESIGQVLEGICSRYAGRNALVHTEAGIHYTYGRLSQEIERVARGFLKLGIRPGDKVALWAPNIPEWLLVFLGLAKIGAVTVPIDPAAARENLHFILEQSESRGLLVAGGSDAEKTLEMAVHAKRKIPSLEHLFVVADSSESQMITWNELMAASAELPKDTLAGRAAAVRPQDPVAIMYTSGTTGLPKGVVLDHLGLINKSLVATERQGISADDSLCLFFPLFHMFGNTCIALAGLLRGATLVMPCKAFAPRKILPVIAAERCTAIYGSPSMLIALIDHPQFQKSGWASLSKGIIGGAPCPMELMRRIVEDIGVSDITVAYGITEASSWITMTHPEDPIELRVATIGTPLPCNEVKITDPATGETLAPGKQGELCTRGFLMTEYYKMPAATAAAIDRENWFHTGDLGVMDPRGYIKITGRLKDVIIRNGVEIYPVELEAIIYLLPGISEVQVFGFPHPQKGQEVAAWIKVKDGAQVSLDAVTAHVQARLPAAKIPQYYKIVPEFPMTGSGKVQKFKMAQMAQAEYNQKH
jgi:fatty-acyl-CoA synthase